jgi:hypothetical protein
METAMRKRAGITVKESLLIVLSLISIFQFPGCQKVIDIDLNEAAPRIVIEGLINDRRGPYAVSISKSGSYFNEPVLPTVSGARVIISDNTGAVDTLRETAPGIYLTSRTRGIPGRTYKLRVISENQEYAGTSTMYSHVNIDSLSLVRSEIQHFDFGNNNENELNMEIHCHFKDPPEKNYYRVRVFKNDSINTQNYRLFDDQYTNGSQTELRVARAEKGADYRVELMSIDKPTYNFYRTLEDLLYTNPFFGSTPANPNSNLSNGALGYFGAYAVSVKTIKITDLLIDRAE